MFNDIARLTSKCIDKETLNLMEVHGRNSRINFNDIGSDDFKEVVQHKFDTLGIRTASTQNFWEAPFVVDTHMDDIPKMPMHQNGFRYDIDALYSTHAYKLSIEAAAAIAILTEITELKKSHIVVVGCNHTTLGLRDTLIANDFTMTQIYRDSTSKSKVLGCADAVVWAEEEFGNLDAKALNATCVLDVLGVIPKCYTGDKIIRNVQDVIMSIMVNRAVFTYFSPKT